MAASMVPGPVRAVGDWIGSQGARPARTESTESAQAQRAHRHWTPQGILVPLGSYFFHGSHWEAGSESQSEGRDARQMSRTLPYPNPPQTPRAQQGMPAGQHRVPLTVPNLGSLEVGRCRSQAVPETRLPHAGSHLPLGLASLSQGCLEAMQPPLRLLPHQPTPLTPTCEMELLPVENSREVLQKTTDRIPI